MHQIITDIHDFRAKRFLRKLIKHPFIAIVYENGEPHVYYKNEPEINTKELKRKMQEAVDLLD